MHKASFVNFVVGDSAVLQRFTSDRGFGLSDPSIENSPKKIGSAIIQAAMRALFHKVQCVLELR
jgi:hypothetical protein